MSFLTIALFGLSLIVGFAVSLLMWAKQYKMLPQIDWLEAIFVSVMGMVILVGWIGVLLASFGIFSLFAIASVIFLLVGWVFWYKRQFPRPKFNPITRHEVFLLIFLAGCSIIYFRPHEYVLGGNDAGGYINIGTTIADTGEFIIQNDEWTAWLRQFPEVTLRQQPAKWRTEYLQFVGWYIDDTDASRIIPQFFPFHPTLLAVGISLGGLMGGLLVTPLWAVLDLLVVYLLTRRLFNRNSALLATVLLAITAVFIYFARYPTTEPLTLLLVFTGLLSWQTLWDNPRSSSLWAVLGGAAFGVALLTRIDLPLVAILIYGWLILVWLQGKWNRNWLVFTVMLSLFSIYAIASAFFLNWPYVWNTYGSLFALFKNKTWLLIFAISVSVGALFIIFLIWKKGWDNFNQGSWGQTIQSSQFRWFLSVTIVSLSLYAYFVRPLLEPARSYVTWPSGTTAWVLDGQNWVRMGWYITPLGILATTLGLAWILRRESLNRLGLFLSVGVLTSIQYVFKIFNTPYHIYTMRRYVPIVLPVLMIFAAYFLVSLYFTHHKRERLTQITTIVFTIIFVGGLLYQSRFVLPLRENRGAVTQLESIAVALQPEAILLVIEPATSVFADTFGAPLRFIYGHDIATIRTDDANAKQFLTDLYDYAENEKRPLQLLAIEPIPPNIEDHLHLKPVTFIPITLQRLMSTFTDYPSITETAYYGVEIYDIITPDTETEIVEQTMIDIGSFDAPYIQSGFYNKESLPEAITMRWTDGAATLEIPADTDDLVQITIRAKIFRPEAVLPSEVVAVLDDQPIGTFTPTEEWQIFTFIGHPHSTNGESLLQFQADTFNPAELNINNDGRDLGFLLDWVEITLGF